MKLIFGRQHWRDAVLERLGNPPILHEEYSRSNGRLEITTSKLGGPLGYFVDSLGELHELEVKGHCFPDGLIYHVLVPKGA